MFLFKHSVNKSTHKTFMDCISTFFLQCYRKKWITPFYHQIKNRILPYFHGKKKKKLSVFLYIHHYTAPGSL